MSASAGALTDHSARPTLLRLSGVEARKMVDTRAGFWLLLLTALAGIGGTIGQLLAASRPSDEQTVVVFFTAAAAAGVLLPIVAILLVTSEWSQRTGLFTFALVPVRGRVVAAKLLATLAVALAAAAFCLVLALIGSSLAGTAIGIDAAEVGRGCLYPLIGIAIGFGLGLAFQSSPVAIVLLFAGPILIGAIGAISNAIGDVTAWLDQSVLIKLVDTPGPRGNDWGKVWVTALVWFVLPLVAGMVRLRRRDID